MPDKPKKTTEPKAAAPRAVHLLIQPAPAATDPDRPTILNLETFTGEIAARRELDNRPGWKYLSLTPGAPYRAIGDRA